ncbi:MAG: glucosaminidase domain-containing protein [Chitinophagales bacterium]
MLRITPLVLPKLALCLKNCFKRSVYFCLTLLLLNSSIAFGQDQTVKEYIEQYRGIAIAEMKRAGVPASITLAQGILESRHGNSRLAVKGNNHFGIKCHSSWTGDRIRANDDAPNECFRKYDNAVESYVDHSNFLGTNRRYGSLFDLEITDYEGWSHGLKKAGYATDPKYATLLISLIERHTLQSYDSGGRDCSYADVPVKDLQDQLKAVGKIFYYNRIKTVLFDCEMSQAQVSEYYNISGHRLQKYNDLSSSAKIQPNTNVYLQPKRRKGPYHTKEHTVLASENMQDVSQTYGIALKHLYRRNKMTPNEQPAGGETLRLRGKRRNAPKLRAANSIKKKAGKTSSSSGSSKNSGSKKFTPKDGQGDNKGKVKPTASQVKHTVKAGDSLYRIAQKYNTTVGAIKELNQLNSDNLNVGQVLVIPQ